MGDNLSFTGSMTLDSFGKTIKFAHQMQLFSHMVETDDHGKQRLIRDAGMLNDLTQREVNYKREESLVKYLLDDSRKFPPILAVITADWVDPKDSENSNDSKLAQTENHIRKKYTKFCKLKQKI